MSTVTFDQLILWLTGKVRPDQIEYLRIHYEQERIVQIVYRPRPSDTSYQKDDIWEFKNAAGTRVFSLLRHHPSLEFHIWRPC